MKDIFRKELLSRTLLLVDKDYKNWTTYNNQINTILYFNNINFVNVKGIDLKTDELPLIECDLKKNYVLISTDRIISLFNERTSQMSIKEIVRFGNEFEQFNNKKASKTNLVSLYDSKGNNLIYEIDSLYPAYFSKILIHNLVNHTSKGEYSW